MFRRKKEIGASSILFLMISGAPKSEQCNHAKQIPKIGHISRFQQTLLAKYFELIRENYETFFGDEYLNFELGGTGE